MDAEPGTELVPAKRPTAVAPWTLEDPYDPDAAQDVVERVAFGMSLQEIAQDPFMPPRELFMVWMMRNSELATAYKRAQEISAYALEDEALFLLREAIGRPLTGPDVRKLELLVNHMRWAAGKRLPSVYSEKATVGITVPIQINTTLDLGASAGQNSTAEFPNIYELRARPVVEVDAEPAGNGELMEGTPSPRQKTKPRARARKRVLTPKGPRLEPSPAERAATRERDRRARARAEAAQ